MKIKQLLGFSADELEAMDDCQLLEHLKPGIEALTKCKATPRPVRNSDAEGNVKVKKKRVLDGNTRLKNLSKDALKAHVEKLSKELDLIEEDLEEEAP